MFCPCVMFSHSTHMYFRLQPVCGISLCSVGVGNVDVFWASVFYKNGHKSRVFTVIDIKISANSSLQSVLFIGFFFTSIGHMDQKLWCFERDTSHSIKKHFYVFFQNAHHYNLRKNTVFKNDWGLSVSMLGLSLMFVYLFKVNFFVGAV